jgi:hypothetical protein
VKRSPWAGRHSLFIPWDEGSHGQSPAKQGENCLALIHRHDQSCHVATLVLCRPTSVPAPAAAISSATARCSNPPNGVLGTAAISPTPTTHSPAAWVVPSAYNLRLHRF